MCGFASAIVAGGTESMSLVPMGGHKIAPNPTLVDRYPDVYLSTGLVAENHARESGISREEQDAFALRSHQRALAAIDGGRFADEIVPVTATLVDAVERRRQADDARSVTFAVDEGPRRDTSPEALGEAAAGVPRARHGDRRQLVADERRRRRGHRHVGGARARARPDAARPLRRVRDRRRRAGAVRHRPGAGDPQGAEARRADARSDRSRRAERSVRRAGARLPEGAADRSRSAERQRRRDRARPSARLHRREADDDAALRDAAPQRALRPGDDVRRRRHGRGGDLRADVEPMAMPS